MLRRAALRAGEAVLVFYGPSDEPELLDRVGLEMIEAVRALRGARLVVATATDGQREFVQSLGFEDAMRGVVSLEEIRRKAVVGLRLAADACRDCRTRSATTAKLPAGGARLPGSHDEAVRRRGRQAACAAPDNPRGYRT